MDDENFVCVAVGVLFTIAAGNDRGATAGIGDSDGGVTAAVAGVGVWEFIGHDFGDSGLSEAGGSDRVFVSYGLLLWSADACDGWVSAVGAVSAGVEFGGSAVGGAGVGSGEGA